MEVFSNKSHPANAELPSGMASQNENLSQGFFLLPPEIRHQIYLHLYNWDYIELIRPVPRQPDVPAFSGNDYYRSSMAPSSVCRAFHDELSVLSFNQTVFHLGKTYGTSPHRRIDPIFRFPAELYGEDCNPTSFPFPPADHPFLETQPYPDHAVCQRFPCFERLSPTMAQFVRHVTVPRRAESYRDYNVLPADDPLIAARHHLPNLESVGFAAGAEEGARALAVALAFPRLRRVVIRWVEVNYSSGGEYEIWHSEISAKEKEKIVGRLALVRPSLVHDCVSSDIMSGFGHSALFRDSVILDVRFLWPLWKMSYMSAKELLDTDSWDLAPLCKDPRLLCFRIRRRGSDDTSGPRVRCVRVICGAAFELEAALPNIDEPRCHHS